MLFSWENITKQTCQMGGQKFTEAFLNEESASGSSASSGIVLTELRPFEFEDEEFKNSLRIVRVNVSRAYQGLRVKIFNRFQVVDNRAVNRFADEMCR